MKRPIATALFLISLFVSLLTAFSSCGKKDSYSSGLEFTENSDGSGYKLTGIGNCTDKNIIIPAEYNNLPVTSVGKGAFAHSDGIKSVKIPSSVTAVEMSAFAYCSNLETVYMSEGLSRIGLEAFYYCSMLTYITIPKSVTDIGTGAFHNCDSLTEIIIPSGVTSIGNFAFASCSALENAVIGGDVNYIGISAFDDCKSLAAVEFVNPEGWHCSEKLSYTKVIPVEKYQLESTVTAADYLVGKYCEYYWRRG